MTRYFEITVSCPLDVFAVQQSPLLEHVYSSSASKLEFLKRFKEKENREIALIFSDSYNIMQIITNGEQL